ncbi:orexin receptor type 2 [Elysia marginata]|uniref:Orexin receptor type 2 n=1 Tax=Elysia marginata TaxID=1093978 RepID=A0AAV4IKS5_9GAST|nr:orexin receptor type 2 [Elysia marginata]
MNLLELNHTDNTSLADLLALYDSYNGATYVNNVVLMIVYVPVFLVAVLGNVLVLLVIFGDVKAVKNSANYFLVNLALADLLGKIVNLSNHYRCCCVNLTLEDMLGRIVNLLSLLPVNLWTYLKRINWVR